MIERDQLQEMFDNIAEKSDWDMSGDMLWGYFFTHSSREPLESASRLLAAEGYRVVDIYPGEKEDDDEPDVWWLHVEKVESHTVDSLNACNERFYEFADGIGLDAYDGMDVGPVETEN
jgi:hypothetical protein